MREQYALWLANAEGIYNRDRHNLSTAFGGALNVYNASYEEIMDFMMGDAGSFDTGKESGNREILTDEPLILLNGKNKGRKLRSGSQRGEELYRNIRLCHEMMSQGTDVVGKLWNDLKEKDIRFISEEHGSFPDRIRNISSAPYGLYYKGNLPGDVPAVAVVGSRRASFYGVSMAAELGRALGERGIPVISGMARGIDAQAQKAALDAGGYSAAVLACGVDVCYPAENRELYNELCQRGGVISELGPGTKPVRTFFPSRNRIISGLADIVVVIEAASASGSLITADMAMDQGRDVYACPGRVGDVMSEGCNRLIAQGAGIITSVDDFLAETGLDRYCASGRYSACEADNDKSMCEPDISHEERMVLELVDVYPVSISYMASRLNMPSDRLTAVLTMLELSGYIRRVSAGYYVRC